MSPIAVLGAGGVGGFVAAGLARAGSEVTVVAREPTAERIGAGGLVVRSARLGDFTAHPRVTTRLTEPADALIVATKATGLGRALEHIECAPTVVLPLLNGLDHMAVLRERFGSGRVAAGTIRVESDRPAPAHIVQTSSFLRIEMAADDPAVARRLPPTAEALDDAGIPAQIVSSEAQVLWSKLVRLCALACTTSASDSLLGFIRVDEEWRRALENCIFEAAAVARAEGADIDPAATLAELAEAHPELGSSMQRDIAAGREPELDAIAGSVLRAGARHGLRCPTIARLSALIAERAGVAQPIT